VLILRTDRLSTAGVPLRQALTCVVAVSTLPGSGPGLYLRLLPVVAVVLGVLVLGEHGWPWCWLTRAGPGRRSADTSPWLEQRTPAQPAQSVYAQAQA
jgi:hypothetical protein